MHHTGDDSIMSVRKSNYAFLANRFMFILERAILSL